MTIPFSNKLRLRVKPGLLDSLRFASATVDDLAEIRHVVGAALRTVACRPTSAVEPAALDAYLASARFVDDLRGRAFVIGRLHGTIVTLGAWRPAPGDTDAALISCVIVHEMFRGLGLARAMVAELEKRVRAAGFATVLSQSYPGFEGLYARLAFAEPRADRKTYAPGVDLPVICLSKPLSASPAPLLWSAVRATRVTVAGVEISAGQQPLDFGRLGKSRSPVFSKAMH